MHFYCVPLLGQRIIIRRKRKRGFNTHIQNYNFWQAENVIGLNNLQPKNKLQINSISVKWLMIDVAQSNMWCIKKNVHKALIIKVNIVSSCLKVLSSKAYYKMKIEWEMAAETHNICCRKGGGNTARNLLLWLIASKTKFKHIFYLTAWESLTDVL